MPGPTTMTQVGHASVIQEHQSVLLNNANLLRTMRQRHGFLKIARKDSSRVVTISVNNLNKKEVLDTCLKKIKSKLLKKGEYIE